MDTPRFDTPESLVHPQSDWDFDEARRQVAAANAKTGKKMVGLALLGAILPVVVVAVFLLLAGLSAVVWLALQILGGIG